MTSYKNIDDIFRRLCIYLNLDLLDRRLQSKHDPKLCTDHCGRQMCRRCVVLFAISRYVIVINKRSARRPGANSSSFN